MSVSIIGSAFMVIFAAMAPSLEIGMLAVCPVVNN